MTDSTGVWVNSEPTVTVTADPFDLETITAARMRSSPGIGSAVRDQWRADREEAERAAQARERRENEVAMMQLRGDPIETSADIFRRAMAIAEAQDKLEAAQAQRERADRATFLAAELAAQAAAEREAELGVVRSALVTPRPRAAG